MSDSTEAQPQEGELLPCPLCKQPLETTLNGRAVCRNAGSGQSPHDGCLLWLENAQLHVETWQALHTRVRATLSTENHVFTCVRCSRQWTVTSGDSLECYFSGLCYWCLRETGISQERISTMLLALEDTTRADLPRATADASLSYARTLAREIIGNVNNYAEDNGELSISAFGPLTERIAKAITAPHATGETTVEACLAELRGNVSVY
jgi:hypothetical protein